MQRPLQGFHPPGSMFRVDVSSEERPDCSRLLEQARMDLRRISSPSAKPSVRRRGDQDCGSAGSPAPMQAPTPSSHGLSNSHDAHVASQGSRPCAMSRHHGFRQPSQISWRFRACFVDGLFHDANQNCGAKAVQLAAAARAHTAPSLLDPQPSTLFQTAVGMTLVGL